MDGAPESHVELHVVICPEVRRRRRASISGTSPTGRRVERSDVTFRCPHEQAGGGDDARGGSREEGGGGEDEGPGTGVQGLFPMPKALVRRRRAVSRAESTKAAGTAADQGRKRIRRTLSRALGLQFAEDGMPVPKAAMQVVGSVHVVDEETTAQTAASGAAHVSTPAGAMAKGEEEERGVDRGADPPEVVGPMVHPPSSLSIPQSPSRAPGMHSSEQQLSDAAA